jgi:hypothetical protein
VPSSSLQSSVVKAWRTTRNVRSSTKIASTYLAAKTTGIAWLATLYGNSCRYISPIIVLQSEHQVCGLGHLLYYLSGCPSYCIQVISYWNCCKYNNHLSILAEGGLDFSPSTVTRGFKLLTRLIGLHCYKPLSSHRGILSHFKVFRQNSMSFLIILCIASNFFGNQILEMSLTLCPARRSNKARFLCRIANSRSRNV